MVLNSFINVIHILEALIPSIEAKIICILRPDKNESPIIYTRFRIRNLFRAVRSASKQFTLNLLKNENPVQNEYWLFSGSVFTVLKLKSEKIKRTENEYFIQNESSLFFQNEYIRFMT